MACVIFAPAICAQQVTFAPYIQLGDNGPFHATDQIVIAWQTDESSPRPAAYTVELERRGAQKRTVIPQARLVDNYLAADASLPAVAGAYGAHSNYIAVLGGLEYDRDYRYRVQGHGMPVGGFASTFHTR
jgi:hypothetical protein